ncbi:plasmid stabilization system protein, RelE/ParE family [Rhodobacteraceae bacterium KLH11]|nr:plasmid stabilization system protein, RelE/ParE family [Rhodobacteraceae bacterium KLH11]EEE35475.1 plasmid stabilization system protein, RelE/ParE family [Rhodobacteraceae bacterium KLH11]
MRQILSYLRQPSVPKSLTTDIYARNVARKMFARADALIDQPGQGRRVPEYDGDKDVREVFVHRWRLIYAVYPDHIRIAAVIHGARLMENVRPL